MANYLDPEEDTPVPGDTQSTDQSKPGFRKAWDAWTSKPENNAALLQFGLAMLQPRSPGQSGIGQFANAIGAGAEASGRVQATEQATQTEEAKREELANLGEYRKAQGQAALQNASAYGRQVDALGAGGTKGLTPIMRAQGTLRSWAVKPEDPLAVQMNNGISTDPIVQAIAKRHPEVKTKADITSNPALMREALGILSMQESAIGADENGVPDATTAPAAAQPARAGVAASTTAPRVARDRSGKTWTETAPGSGVFKDAAGNIYSP